MRWHPDRPGGDLETMQIINAQYHQALKAADGTQTKGDDDKYRTYTYNEETIDSESNGVVLHSSEIPF